MKNAGSENKKSVKKINKLLINGSALGTGETAWQMQPKSMPVAYKHIPIVVSEQQFKSVETAHVNSVNLLDSCANALLSALEMSIPPKDSGRTIGEYTGQNMRQLAKSVCDIVSTKTGVVRSMYQISRDEI